MELVSLQKKVFKRGLTKSEKISLYNWCSCYSFVNRWYMY